MNTHTTQYTIRADKCATEFAIYTYHFVSETTNARETYLQHGEYTQTHTTRQRDTHIQHTGTHAHTYIYPVYTSPVEVNCGSYDLNSQVCPGEFGWRVRGSSHFVEVSYTGWPWCVGYNHIHDHIIPMNTIIRIWGGYFTSKQAG